MATLQDSIVEPIWGVTDSFVQGMYTGFSRDTYNNSVTSDSYSAIWISPASVEDSFTANEASGYVKRWAAEPVDDSFTADDYAFAFQTYMSIVAEVLAADSSLSVKSLRVATMLGGDFQQNVSITSDAFGTKHIGKADLFATASTAWVG